MEKVKQKLLGSMLHKIGHATPTHENVNLALATRERVRGFSNINSLKYELRAMGFKIVDHEYNQYWKDWQAAGLGVISPGKGKKQTKFIHFYDMRKVAQAALEGKDIEVVNRQVDAAKVRAENVEAVAKVLSEAPKTKSEVAAPKPTPSVNHVFVSIRPSVLIDFTLPHDITPDEIARLREALDRLTPAKSSQAA